MLFKGIALTALASAASAQTMNLTAALGSNPNLSNLTSYLGLFPDLISTLSAAVNITLLAPNNAAFAKFLNSSAGADFSLNNTALIQSFFAYHVLSGTHYASEFTEDPQFFPTALSPATGLTLLQPAAVVEAIVVGKDTKFISGVLTESTVTSPNNNFTGGVFHVVDTLLTIPQNISATLVPLNETAATGALEKANIAGGSLPNNLTAFIPNNRAFQAIGNLVANLSMANLTQILGYHFVPNMVLYSTDLANMTNMTLPTFDNLTMTVTADNGTVYVNNAKVVIPDVLVLEGVVHIIDEVLNPANRTLVKNKNITDVAFAGAMSGPKVPFTSGIPSPTTVPAGASSDAGGAVSAASSQASASSSSSKGGAVRPIQTGAVGAAALFGGAAAVMNL